MRVVISLLKLFVSREHYCLIGDIHEMYESMKENSGRVKAFLWLLVQIPGTLIPLFKDKLSWYRALLSNYFHVAVRNIYRNKLYSSINITGLSIGITCSILIFMWVSDELSYDKHFDKDLYRFVLKFKGGRSSKTPDSMAQYLKVNIPEIVDYTQLHKRPKWSVSYTSESGKKRVFYESNLFLTDPALFRMFNLKFVHGDISTGFRGVVISEKVAEKYFGNENPLGKKLNFNNWYDAEVTAVVANIPENSHFTGEMYSNRLGLKRHWPGGFNWSNHVHDLYLKVREGSNIADIETRIHKLLLDMNINMYRENLKAVKLERIDRIYLHGSDISSDYARYGDIKYIYIFTIVAVFILFIACLNFMNLMTAKAENRIREVGIRKAAGAGMGSLIPQFIGESVLFASISGTLALILIYISLPSFNTLINKELQFSLISPVNLLLFISTIIVTGIFAGIYPAVFISSRKTVEILKGTKRSVGKLFNLRNVLVIIQFGFSIFLIIGTLVTTSQLSFIQKKKLGFSKEHILCVPFKDNFAKSFKIVKQQLLKNPAVKAVSFKDCYPTRSVSNTTIDWPERGSKKRIGSEHSSVEFDYTGLMNIEIVQGRGFSQSIRGDIDKSVIINQILVNKMGFKDPVGKQITLGNSKRTIVGVMKDANFKSLHQRVRPLVLKLTEHTDDALLNLFGIIMVKIAPGAEKDVLEQVKSLWMKMNSSTPFDYNFLDDVYNNLYKKESTVSSIINVFSILAIFISSLGIFGLASFSAEQRTREIGVRKVLGASTKRIVALLSKDFLKLVLISNIVAWPVAYYMMDNWLKDFEYQIDINIWFFLGAGITAMIIAQLSVSYQSFRAASTDPVNSLKHN